MRDVRMDHLIRNSLSAQSRRTSDPCMSENLMAAYLEKSLSPEERNAVESHVANCTACQEVLALALKLHPQEESAPLQTASTHSKKMLFHFSIPIPALGALLVCIAVGALFFRWPHRAPETALREGQVEALGSSVPKADRPFAQMASDSETSERAQIDVPVAQTRTAVAKGESKVTSSPVAHLAPPPPLDGLQSIPATNRAEMPKKVADSMERVVAGTVATSPSQAVNESSAARDEVTAASRAAPTALAMAALPAGAGSGAAKDLRAKEGESVGPKADEPAAAVPAQSVHTPATGRSETAPVTSTVPSSPAPAARPADAVASAETNLKAKMEAGKPGSPTPEQPAEAIVLARTQQPVIRPHLYAASNRIATSLYETESVESSLQFVIKNLSLNLKTAESRKIGDRMFYKHLGFSIDEQCMKHAENPIVSITVQDPEYKTISEKYPGILSILPAAIYWESKNYLLK